MASSKRFLVETISASKSFWPTFGLQEHTFQTHHKILQTGQTVPGLGQKIIGKFNRSPVVSLQKKIPHACGENLAKTSSAKRIAERFGHFFVVDLDKAVVEPVFYENFPEAHSLWRFHIHGAEK